MVSSPLAPKVRGFHKTFGIDSTRKVPDRKRQPKRTHWSNIMENPELPLPLHLHTVFSLCADLISGRAVGVGEANEPLRLALPEARAILNWYWTNQKKWAGQLRTEDAEAIADASATAAPILNPARGSAREKPSPQYRLTRIQAHRFAGIHGYGTASEAPEDFFFEPAADVTVFEGVNGSGKTSIVNAVVWCLTGKLYRPQRAPETAVAEFEYQVDREDSSSPDEFSLHALTPVTPIPNPMFFTPTREQATIPVDTWVELTLTANDGSTVTLRRAQSRTPKKKLQEITSGFESLSIDPVSFNVGTIMPALIPYIQLGDVSSLGEAVSKLTGLADLLDLARHAKKAKAKLAGDLSKERLKEIEKLDKDFTSIRANLLERLDEFPAMRPSEVLPMIGESTLIEESLERLADHFIGCKQTALLDAQTILGGQFDPMDVKARKDLEDSIGPAIGELSNIKRLSSASRLHKLGNLSAEETLATRSMLLVIRQQAATLAELAANPSVASRKQLYARVADWLQQAPDPTIGLNLCPVCSSDINAVLDPITGCLVSQHIEEAMRTDANLIGQTVGAWSRSTLGILARDLPDALKAETGSDLPCQPRDLIRDALVTELFESQCFKNSLSVLKPISDQLCSVYLAELPDVPTSRTEALPTDALGGDINLSLALKRIERALEFSSWRKMNAAVVTTAFKAIVCEKQMAATVGAEVEGSAASTKSLLDLLEDLKRIVDGVAPINSAISLCGSLTDALKARRKKELRLRVYANASAALEELIQLGSLTQKQVEDLRLQLCNRTIFWRDRIYRKTHTSAYDLLDVTIQTTGAIGFEVGTGCARAPAQHVTNASALRANLMGFFLAFWEHVLTQRGGLRLLVLDDPQELLDDENRERLADALPEMVEIGGQLLVTTNDSKFARFAARAAGRAAGVTVDHRAVFPVTLYAPRVRIPISVAGLDSKRRDFQLPENIDNAQPARDYLAEVRVFLEARLSELFDDPAYAQPVKQATLSDLLGRLRSKMGAGANELFRSPAVRNFCKHPGLFDNSPCLTLLNRVHHGDKDSISFMEVKAVETELYELSSAVEEIHDDYRLWRKREPQRSAKLQTIQIKAITPPSMNIEVYPELAAFTREPSARISSAGADKFEGSWFEQKALYYIACHNFGFAAPLGSVAVVETEEGEVEDGRLVIVIDGDRVLARRLLRPKDKRSGSLALAALPANPLKAPPTVMRDMEAIKVMKVVGILFDDRIATQKTKQEAVQIEEAPCLQRIETAFRVRDQSALPLALPDQIVLGGAAIRPSDMAKYEGRLAAIALDDGSSIFKRISVALPGDLAHVRIFESIGGLGDSQPIMVERVEGRNTSFPLLVSARLILGVLYRG